LGWSFANNLAEFQWDRRHCFCNFRRQHFHLEPDTLIIYNPDVAKMPSPNDIFANWHGLEDNDLFATIRTTFELPPEDSYVYRAESFAMTLAQIEEQVQTGTLKYKYQAHGQPIEVSSATGSQSSRNVD
jgi:hypothetical protein